MNEIEYAIKRRLTIIEDLAENKEVWIDDLPTDLFCVDYFGRFDSAEKSLQHYDIFDVVQAIMNYNRSYGGYCWLYESFTSVTVANSLINAVGAEIVSYAITELKLTGVLNKAKAAKLKRYFDKNLGDDFVQDQIESLIDKLKIRYSK